MNTNFVYNSLITARLNDEYAIMYPVTFLC